MLKYQIVPEREVYVSGEAVRFKLRIENAGPDPVPLPDPEDAYAPEPTYGLRGPTYPGGTAYTRLSLFKERNPGIDPPASREMVIPPGEVREIVVPAAASARLSPGEYELFSALGYQGTKTSAASKKFRVAPAQPVSVHLGLGERPLNNGEGRLVFLQRQGESTVLYAARFRESRADIGEMNIDAPIAQMTLGVNATDVATQWRNSPFFIEYVQWTVWREGRQIGIGSDADTQPEFLTLAADPLFLVRPPLKARTGPTEILVVTAGNTLDLCQFPDYSRKPRPASSVSWSIPLPARPVAGVAAIGPEKEGGTRHVALLVDSPHGLEILHTAFSAAAKPPGLRSISVAGHHIVPNASPTMIVDKDGRTHVSLLATSDGGPALVAVEAVFERDGSPVGKPAVLELGPAGGKVTGGAILYVGKEGTTLRRNMVVAVEGRGILQPRGGALVPVSVQGSTPNPVILAPGAQFTYILYFSPERGFYFEPL